MQTKIPKKIHRCWTRWLLDVASNKLFWVSDKKDVVMYSASLSQKAGAWSGMGRSLGLTPKFICFCECNSSGTWIKMCSVLWSVLLANCCLSHKGVHCTNITASRPGGAVVEACWNHWKTLIKLKTNNGQEDFLVCSLCLSSQAFVTKPRKSNHGLCKEHKYPVSAYLLPCANTLI